MGSVLEREKLEASEYWESGVRDKEGRDPEGVRGEYIPGFGGEFC